MNRKAVIGTTLTWIFALVLIGFILFWYLASVYWISTSNKLKSPLSLLGFYEEIEFGSDSYRLMTTNNFLVFLRNNEDLIYDWSIGNIELPVDKANLYPDEIERLQGDMLKLQLSSNSDFLRIMSYNKALCFNSGARNFVHYESLSIPVSNCLPQDYNYVLDYQSGRKLFLVSFLINEKGEDIIVYYYDA